LAAAGIISVLGSVYWWFKDMLAPQETQIEDDDEPVAMGFGDVKLAAVLGAMLGWKVVLVAIMLAFIIGAVAGVIGRLLGGGRVVPFGPSLVIGGVLALFIGQPLMQWYLGMIGI
jgi:leader peptidase (prepilin peptidase)/N-methyltransferase